MLHLYNELGNSSQGCLFNLALQPLAELVFPLQEYFIMSKIVKKGGT
jgi:hypothetical protein